MQLIVRKPMCPAHRQWLTMMCEMNSLGKEGRGVGKQPRDASGAPPTGTEAQ